VEGEGSKTEGLMKRVGRRYNALSFLTREGEDEGFVLRWSETRQLFLEYVDFKKYNPRNAKKMVSYLDRVVKELVKAPLDVMKMF
jgi:hypothetical protein